MNQVRVDILGHFCTIAESSPTVFSFTQTSTVFCPNWILCGYVALGINIQQIRRNKLSSVGILDPFCWAVKDLNKGGKKMRRNRQV